MIVLRTIAFRLQTLLLDDIKKFEFCAMRKYRQRGGYPERNL
jgi:hypothetical protein